jgi:hypothetical protein
VDSASFEKYLVGISISSAWYAKGEVMMTKVTTVFVDQGIPPNVRTLAFYVPTNWVRLIDPRVPGLVWLQLYRGADGRVSVSGLVVDQNPRFGVGGYSALTPEILRAVDIASVELEANALGDQIGDLDPLATEWLPKGLPEGEPFPDPVQLLVQTFLHRKRQSKSPRNRVRLTSQPRYETVGKGRITDEYLEKVALAYLDAVRRHLKPAPTLAKDVGVSVHTIHKWIKEARKRGMLPPGRAGRVG